MRLLSLVLALLIGACTSMPKQERFALELINRNAPAAAFRAIGEEITVTQLIVDTARAAVDSDDRLMAFAQLPQGVHPYMVIAFVKRKQAIEVLMTSVYWGKVQGKWRASIDPATVESIVQLATNTFDCSRGLITEFLFGTALIHWPEGDQVDCDGGWGTEQGAAFAERFQPIFDGADLTYEPP